MEAVVSGFAVLLDWHLLLLMLLGACIGMVFGILPGLSGMTALALLMPFTFTMDPYAALAFLLSAHAVIYTGGSVTAILLNIPGAGPNAATLIDGFPMTQKGLAGRALGAALTSSGVGGVIGAVALMGLIFVVRPIVMAFGLPEYFFLVFLGLAFISVIGGKATKGLISGALGILVSFVGIHALSGEVRLTFGSMYLFDGFNVIPLALGLFALPELVRMFLDPSASLAQGQEVSVRFSDVVEGIKDVFRHAKLCVASSIIGTTVGIIPGVGGETAPFVAYGVARSFSKHPEKFGEGTVEGVIAPESANNAKEGGSLLPTLAFGIPGSAGMALLLGAFLIVGLKPGPMLLSEHPSLPFTLVGAVVVGNLIGVALLLAIGHKLASLSLVRGSILGPLLMAFVVIGAFATRTDMMDVVFVFIFGALGYAMKAFGYNRPALFLGFVLGSMAERYLGLSLNTHGMWFFFRPLSLTLFVLTILVLFSDPIRARLPRRKHES